MDRVCLVCKDKEPKIDTDGVRRWYAYLDDDGQEKRYCSPACKKIHSDYGDRAIYLSLLMRTERYKRD